MKNIPKYLDCLKGNRERSEKRGRTNSAKKYHSKMIDYSGVTASSQILKSKYSPPKRLSPNRKTTKIHPILNKNYY